MALTTRIAAAEDAFETLLKARALIVADKVRVDVGFPPGGLRKREHIWIGSVLTNWTQEWSVSGLSQVGFDAGKDESFTLSVRLYASSPKDDHKTIRDRLIVLVGEVEKVLRADHTLSGTVMLAEFAGGEWDEGMSEDVGRWMVADLRMRCDAHLGD